MTIHALLSVNKRQVCFPNTGAHVRTPTKGTTKTRKCFPLNRCYVLSQITRTHGCTIKQWCLPGHDMCCTVHAAVFFLYSLPSTTPKKQLQFFALACFFTSPLFFQLNKDFSKKIPLSSNECKEGVFAPLRGIIG